MSLPEHQAIVDEIRSARIVATPQLRERVLALSATPTAPPRRVLPWRRAAFVLAPACLALAVAGALAAGLLTSGKSSRQTALQRKAATPFAVATAPADSGSAPLRAQATTEAHGAAAGRSGSGSAAVPATPGRAQLYAADLTLEVKSLSAATKRALRLTRGFHGYVRSVDYGAGRERGTATLVVRIPVGSIQAALVRFSALGTIVDQHVSIQDVQPGLDRRFRQMQSLRDAIAKLQAQLENPSLSSADRTLLVGRLLASRRRLVVLERAQARAKLQTSFATVSLGLRSPSAAVAPPHDEGRIGRALDRSGEILLDELKVLLYVLVVGAPLLVLAGLVVGAARVRRRRLEARLLAR